MILFWKVYGFLFKQYGLALRDEGGLWFLNARFRTFEDAKKAAKELCANTERIVEVTKGLGGVLYDSPTYSKKV